MNFDLKFLLWAVVCFLSCNEAGNTKVLYLAHTLPTSHPVHRGIETFKDELEKLSEGAMSLKIFPDGQLGSEREMVELLQIGSIDLTKVSAAVMVNFVPGYEVLSIPYLFRDKAHLFQVLEGEVGQYLLDSGSEYWLSGLCFYDAGSRSFYTKDQPIRSPDDLKGLKIRVMNNEMSIKMVNALGGSATPLAFGEVYTAIQQGVVDGAENNPPSLVSSNHYEVCGYYTLDEHLAVPDVVIVSTKTLKKLSEIEKGWLTQAAKNSVGPQKRFWNESVQECMTILESAGVEIIRPDKTAFSEKTASILDEMRTNEALADLILKIESL